MKHGKCIFVRQDVYSRMRTIKLDLLMQKGSRVVQMIIAHKGFHIKRKVKKVAIEVEISNSISSAVKISV